MKRSIGYVLAVLVLILLALYPPVNGAEAADEPRFTGVSFEVLTLYENYFDYIQLLFVLSGGFFILAYIIENNQTISKEEFDNNLSLVINKNKRLFNNILELIISNNIFKANDIKIISIILNRSFN